MILKGLGVSKGQVISKILLYPKKEYTGEFILVCDATYPEMMHIIVKAKGIICRYGGLLSHSAIVSRELGIPCIVNIDIDKIKDNDLIRMDGNLGTIEFLKN